MTRKLSQSAARSLPLLRVARVVRSKNAGPFELTLDVLFKNASWFEFFKRRRIITPGVVARLYRVSECDVLGIIYFEPAQALKITLRRRVPSGSLGDSDIYGAQQHAPLLAFRFNPAPGGPA